MDSIFRLSEDARAAFLQQISQTFGCTYICLWTYLPLPAKYVFSILFFCQTYGLILHPLAQILLYYVDMCALDFRAAAYSLWMESTMKKTSNQVYH